MLALTVILLAPSSAVGAPARVGPLLAITDVSPFTSGCGGDLATIPGMEVEPSLAVNPRNPRNVIAAWQQDRIKDGGALGNFVGVSRDGGATFTRSAVPGLTRCGGGPYERASDPWVAIGPDGTAYLASVAGAVRPEGLRLAVTVNRSTDGGRTWSQPVVVADDTQLNDKETLTPDPLVRGHAYLTWVRFTEIPTPAGPVTINAVYFSRTTNGGRTWTRPRAITETPSDRFDQSAEILVLPNGTLLNVFTRTPGSVPRDRRGIVEILAIRSTDRGRTWSPPVRVGQANAFPTGDPESGKPIRAPNYIFSVDAAPDGTAYIGVIENTSNTAGQVLIFRSTNGGRSWSRRTPAARVAAQVFVPTLAVGPDGTVAVSYYDLRDDVPGDEALTATARFSHSENGGRAWRDALLAGPFDMRQADQERDLFVGDYEGLAPIPGGFAHATVQARPQAQNSPTDVFFGRVAVPPLRPRLSVRPAGARAGRRTCFRFVAATSAGRAVGVTVRFAGVRRRTDSEGVAIVCARFRRPATAVARVDGGGSARVRIAR